MAGPPTNDLSPRDATERTAEGGLTTGVAGDVRVEGQTAEQRVSRPSATDSPWFWVYLFAAAGLVALWTAGPKYTARQSQLERQYRARVATQQTTEIPGVIAATERPSQPFVPLWPLAAVLALVALGGGSYVMWHVRRPR